MKKITVLQGLIGIFLLIGSGSVSAISANTLSAPGESFGVTESIGTTGNFNHLVDFTVSGGAGSALNLSGSHGNMFFNELLITVIPNTVTPTLPGLSNNFDMNFSLADGDYTLSISGFAFPVVVDGWVTNAYYDITMSAVPLPAAVWLFGSVILGFFAFGKRQPKTTYVA